ncbi:hypothetical protein V1527DRAFT_279733 [Lipomyces starkeyi]
MSGCSLKWKIILIVIVYDAYECTSGINLYREFYKSQTTTNHSPSQGKNRNGKERLTIRKRNKRPTLTQSHHPRNTIPKPKHITLRERRRSGNPDWALWPVSRTSTRIVCQSLSVISVAGGILNSVISTSTKPSYA